MCLVWVFFLNVVGFIARQGGGHWVLPVHSMPATGFVAGGGTASFAQLGIVVFLKEGGQGKLQGNAGFGSG